MFKIKYYDIGSSYKSNESFKTRNDALTHLSIKDFKFNKNKNIFERRLGRHYQEALIIED